MPEVLEDRGVPSDEVIIVPPSPAETDNLLEVGVLLLVSPFFSYFSASSFLEQPQAIKITSRNSTMMTIVLY